MSNERSLLELGVNSLRTEIKNRDDLNFDALGQACARKARMSKSVGDVRSWVLAGVECFEKSAALLNEHFIAHGQLLGAFRLRLFYISRSNHEIDDLAQQYINDSKEWILQGIQAFESSEQFKKALADPGHDEHLCALELNDKIEIAQFLKRKGLAIKGLHKDWFTLMED